MLEFKCIGDSIPWSFVKEMADRLWEIACLGATDLFEAVYQDGAGKIAVAVSLKLLEGDSSSASVDSEFSASYREGSVPSVGSPYGNP